MEITYLDVMVIVQNGFKKLNADRQGSLIAKNYNAYYGSDLEIYPTETFNALCKKRFKDNYVGFALSIKEAYPDRWDSDGNYYWCVWSENFRVLRATNDIDQFIHDDTVFFESLIDSAILHEMGIPDWLIDEMLRIYSEHKLEEEAECKK